MFRYNKYSLLCMFICGCLVLAKTPIRVYSRTQLLCSITMCVSVFRYKKYNLLCTSIYAFFQKNPVKLYLFILKYSYSPTIKNFVMYIASFFQKTLSKYITPYRARTSTRQKLATNININEYNLSLSVCLVLTKLPIKVYS